MPLCGFFPDGVIGTCMSTIGKLKSSHWDGVIKSATTATSLHEHLRTETLPTA